LARETRAEAAEVTAANAKHLLLAVHLAEHAVQGLATPSCTWFAAGARLRLKCSPGRVR